MSGKAGKQRVKGQQSEYDNAYSALDCFSGFYPVSAGPGAVRLLILVADLLRVLPGLCLTIM